MKTTKFFTALTSLILIFLASYTASANFSNMKTGDEPKTTIKKVDSAEKRNSSETTLPAASENEFNYLRFEVSKFMVEGETEIGELPAANEFEYLRFNVNNFFENTGDDIIEMPVNEFDYLRFDVNNYSGIGAGEIEELPIAE